MIPLLKRVVSKLAAVLLLAGVAAAIYAAGIEPMYARFSEVRAQIEVQRQLLGRYEATAAMNEEAAKAKKPDRNLEAGKVFVSGNSDALRLAELQSRLKSVVEGEGVVIESVRTVPAKNRDGLHLLGIDAQLSAEIGKLQRILHKLETHRPYLFVETLQISASPLLSADNPGAGSALSVRLGLYGAASGVKD